MTESFTKLTTNAILYRELRVLLRYKLNHIDEVVPPVKLPFICPLELHSDYSRDEILAALGVWTLEKQREVREGVLFVKELATDVFFVTLNKTERDYSPTTMYDDYAINETLFHWQSQSTTSTESQTGLRYIHQREKGHTVLLFVREDKKRSGVAAPYCYLGPVDYVSHEGSKPINIVWQLRTSLPARLLRRTARLQTA